MRPDFQKGHIWVESQQIKYVEFLLSGGYSGKDIYFNCPGWMQDDRWPMVIVDGLQRVTACLRFVRNQIPAYNNLYRDFDRIPSLIGLIFHVNNLIRRSEVLRWYIQLNDGGVSHTPEELDYVRKLLEKEE